MCGSVVERVPDKNEVPSSILGTPTMAEGETTEVTQEMTEMLNSVSTETLIGILKGRELTAQDIESISLLRPADTTTNVNNSEAFEVTEAVGAQDEGKPSAERFAKAVIRKNAHGKLAAGTKVIGIPITDPTGFYDHGPDKIQRADSDKNVAYLHNLVYEKQKQFPDLIGSHIVSVAPSTTDESSRILTLRFFQDRKQEDSRGWCTPAYISTELPADVATEFLSEIAQHPDLLEDFYQRTFPDMDSEGDRLGFRRVRADGLYIIPDDKLAEISSMKTNDTRGVTPFFTSIGKLQYQNGPYGTGDTFSA